MDTSASATEPSAENYHLNDKKPALGEYFEKRYAQTLNIDDSVNSAQQSEDVLEINDTDISSGAATPSFSDEEITLAGVEDVKKKQLRKEESAEYKKLKAQLTASFATRKEKLLINVHAREKKLVEKQNAFVVKEKERIAALANLHELEAVLNFRKIKADQESVNLHVIRENLIAERETLVIEHAKAKQDVRMKAEEHAERTRKLLAQEQQRIELAQEQDASTKAREHATKTSYLLAWEQQLNKLAQELNDCEDCLQAQITQKTSVSPPILSILEGKMVSTDGKIYNDDGVAIGMCISEDVQSIARRQHKIDNLGVVRVQGGSEVLGKCSVLAIKKEEESIAHKSVITPEKTTNGDMNDISWE